MYVIPAADLYPGRRDPELVGREHVVPECRLREPLHVPEQHVGGDEEVRRLVEHITR